MKGKVQTNEEILRQQLELLAERSRMVTNSDELLCLTTAMVNIFDRLAIKKSSLQPEVIFSKAAEITKNELERYAKETEKLVKKLQEDY